MDFFESTNPTPLAILTIFPARNLYFERNVFFCCRYLAPFTKPILNNKNKLKTSINN